jgi:hypothetical protein
VGLLTGLILLPLAPVRGVAWLAEQVVDQASQEDSGADDVYRQIAELDEARESGTISPEECNAAEDALVARLLQARSGLSGRPEADGG